MADSSLQYLEADFDPSSLTVPRLRSILVEHNVAYPSSAKKSQLVDLFNGEVAPQARRLLSSRTHTKRSARGILDVPSSAEPSLNGDDDTDSVASEIPPPRSTRKTPRASSTRYVDEHSPPRTARSTRSSRASASLFSESEAESTRATPVPRRTRPSVMPASVREEEVTETEPETEPEPVRSLDVESAFTQDNPFQNNSPLLDETPVPPERRRRTLGLTREKNKTESSVRRRTDFTAVREDEEPITKPITRGRKSTSVKLSSTQVAGLALDGSPEPGEEFTPEEQMELEQVSGKGTEVATLKPPRRAKESNGLLSSAVWAISLAMLGGVATLWRQEKVQVGYCGIGRPSLAIAGIHIPEWADSLRPQCEPCPPHAYCYSKMRTNCETDFIMQPHPLSIGGLVPLPPTCEADGEKARKVKAVADRAVEELRERNAKWECGELRDADGKREPQVAIQEPVLKSAVANKKRKGMSQDEFEDLWHAALGEMMSRDEIVSSVDGTSGHRTLRSTSLARVPFSCAVRRSLRLALARHLWKLVAVIAVLVAGLYTRFSVTSARATEVKAKQLASFALDRLAAQAAIAASDPERYPEGYISMSQLRDDVLRDEFSAKRRQKLWEKVQRKVEGNSNVRSSVREARSGEVSRVWEWVGAVAAIEDGGGAGGRRDGARMSLGMPLAGGGSPAAYGSGVKEEEGVRSVGERKRWKEERPVY